MEEASKERLQDLTTALCKNTEVGAMGSDIPRWSTQGTADPSTQHGLQEWSRHKQCLLDGKWPVA